MISASRKYVVRLGFGSEGHGTIIIVASGATSAVAKARARASLQAQFGGLWVSKYRECYVGSADWLAREFPGPGVRDVLASQGQ